MTTTAESSGSETPIVYTGRHRYDLSGIWREVVVLTDVDASPHVLRGQISGAPGLIILDPLSFPWDSFRHDIECPLWIVLDSSRPETDLVHDLLGSVLLNRLTFYDRIVTESESVAHDLIERYGLAVSQVRVRPDMDPEDAIQLAIDELTRPTAEGLTGEYETSPYWVRRGEMLAASHPAQAVGSLHHGLAENKAMHLTQDRALRPFLDRRPSHREWRVAEVGCGVGRWAAGLGPHVEFIGFDISEAMIDIARTNFPSQHFGALGESDPLPLVPESQDVVFTCTVLHHNPIERRMAILRQMFRAVRVGGALLFLEDFVSNRQSDGTSTVFPMSINEFLEQVLAATFGMVVLRHMESLRYQHDPFHRGGLLALTKVGTPLSL